MTTSSTKTLEHRGLTGSVEVSLEDGVLHGRVLYIEDLILFEASTVAELKTAFEATVDEYIADLAAEGKPVPTPFKGTFNVRVGPELHRLAVMAADRRGTSLNDIVRTALAFHLEQPKVDATAVPTTAFLIEARTALASHLEQMNAETTSAERSAFSELIAKWRRGDTTEAASHAPGYVAVETTPSPSTTSQPIGGSNHVH